MELTPAIREYYDRGGEIDRLELPVGRLEFLRTQDVLQRVLPPPDAPSEPSGAGHRILDVGGGTGVHARWLVSDGWVVHLVDPLALHVEHAGRIPGVEAANGDARQLANADNYYAATLLLGPLYHLTSRDDRVQALREAARVTRPGGVVVAATISRFSSVYDCLARNRYWDSTIRESVAHDLQTGVHRDVTTFTMAYFHHPDEPVSEFADAGLIGVQRYALEGAAWLLPDPLAWSADPGRTAALLDVLRSFECDPSMLGISSHMLTVGRVPPAGEPPNPAENTC